uniref:Palmitoyltransferase n=1 Tax=Neobodo designis TaxID=312471 RepID=A0A7S1R043_NEODS|mmetsp:Transcript_5952/g.18795  ORF Transcript_5952/g.18795 Transcript_5952/m.18795 type:complete len:430 (+) Transcript_5952:110-1399(+)|eukprot:CAMPEP_0174828638 /NCGR_PEP_ID=MMETSP1114-20130205/1459_1 /TAXON_ID=312471 /ORGANISM="Neobodo designis, Strain CCAP 1951/1" /LENGTH=429 /DNA_ID=CAMNT_0016062361 /DNA_START=108 /DNA_END=1397 /DNA_ORIENTATION=+
MHHGTESEDPEHESEYYGGPSTPARPPPRRVNSDGDDDDDGALSPHMQTTSGVEVRQLDRSAESANHGSPVGTPGGSRSHASPPAPRERTEDDPGSYSPANDDEFADVAPSDRSPALRSSSPLDDDSPRATRNHGGREESLQMTSVRGDSAPPQATPTPAKQPRRKSGAQSSGAPVPAPPPAVERKASHTRRASASQEGHHHAVPCIHGHVTVNDDSWRTKPPRTHGFHRPFHVLQIAAWTVTVVVLMLSFMTTTRAIDDYDSTEDGYKHTPMHIAFGLFCAIAFAFGIAASASDPTDYSDPQPGDDHVFCGTCQRRVHRSSKHCKVCNRCALEFDHHCKWLNNCIGKKNYFLFYMYVVTLLMCIVFGVTSTIYFLAKYWAESNAAEQAFAIIACVLYALAAAPLLHLFGFHVMLWCKGITTYQYLTGG